MGIGVQKWEKDSACEPLDTKVRNVKKRGTVRLLISFEQQTKIEVQINRRWDNEDEGKRWVSFSQIRVKRERNAIENKKLST